MHPAASTGPGPSQPAAAPALATQATSFAIVSVGSTSLPDAACHCQLASAARLFLRAHGCTAVGRLLQGPAPLTAQAGS